MKIILYKDVPNLGEEGDIKIVVDGYARNYLLPKKFAVKFNKSTEIELAQKQHAILRRKEEKKLAASDDKDKIESLEMQISVAAGDKGKLFGSVTSSTITDFLASNGIFVEKKKIELPDNGIKVLGNHIAEIKLYGGKSATLKINVTALTESKDDQSQSKEKVSQNDNEVEEKDVVKEDNSSQENSNNF